MASKKPWETLIPRDNPFLPGWTPKEPALGSESSSDDESSSDGGSGEDKPVCDPLAMPRNWAWGEDPVEDGDDASPHTSRLLVRQLLMEGRKLHTIFSWLKEQVENKWENLLPKTESWKDLLEVGRKQLSRTLLLDHKNKRFTRLDGRRNGVDIEYLETPDKVKELHPDEVRKMLKDVFVMKGVTKQNALHCLSEIVTHRDEPRVGARELQKVALYQLFTGDHIESTAHTSTAQFIMNNYEVCAPHLFKAYYNRILRCGSPFYPFYLQCHGNKAKTIIRQAKAEEEQEQRDFQTGVASSSSDRNAPKPKSTTPDSMDVQGSGTNGEGSAATGENDNANCGDGSRGDDCDSYVSVAGLCGSDDGSRVWEGSGALRKRNVASLKDDVDGDEVVDDEADGAPSSSSSTPLLKRKKSAPTLRDEDSTRKTVEDWAHIHSPLMIKLCKLNTAMIDAGKSGSPYLHEKAFQNSPYAKMNVHNGARLIKLIALLQEVADDKWFGEAIDWSLPALQHISKLTDQEKLTCLGVAQFARGLQDLFTDCLMDYNKPLTQEKLDKAWAVAVDWLGQHLALNPTLERDNLDDITFSRYQLEGLFGLLHFFQRLLDDATRWNKLFEDDNTYAKAMVHTGRLGNSIVEHIFSGLRYMTGSMTLDSSNVSHIWETYSWARLGEFSETYSGSHRSDYANAGLQEF